MKKDRSPSQHHKSHAQHAAPKGLTFQDLLLTLEEYWASRDCVLQQPYDVEVGAGTMHPETFLRVLGPDATLRRGYSITMNERGQIIRTVAAVRPKMKIRTRVSDGEFGSKVL